MKLRKNLTALSALALISAGSLMISSQSVKAANNSYNIKTVMHSAAAYDKNGKSTGKVYKSYQKVNVDSGIVRIKGNQFYKLSGKDEYLKINNIDGVERTVKHNAYVYATSTRRANGRVVKKGTTIVTYGGSYKFKNGKRYYRVGGPAKQYVKVANLGSVIDNTSTTGNSSSSVTTNTNSTTSSNATSTSDGETTVTVTYPYSNYVNIYDENGKVIKTDIKVGTKFTVDRREITKFASEFPPGSILDGFYRIKGTNHWIKASQVKAAKELPLHNYNDEHYSYIKFIQPTDLYNANGTIQILPNNRKIRKQGEFYKVDRLTYLWIPSENKAELFYHLTTNRVTVEYVPGLDSEASIKDGYVKASDVKFAEGVKLTPDNTPEAAKAAYETSQSSNK